jgi:hypothetical protein
VELLRSTLYGYAESTPTSIGITGGPGVLATSGSRVHAVLSNINGGPGSGTTGGSGGSGGSGIALVSASHAILAGDGTQQILGGDSGYGDGTTPFPCYDEGYPGSGAWVEAGAQLAWSGVVLNGGLSYQHFTCAQYYGAPISGAATHVVPDDPTLALVGIPTAGSTVTIRLLAPPGSQARLKMGRNAIVVADGLAPIEDLATSGRIVNLGIVPPSGVRTVTWQIPSVLSAGTFLVLQAEATPPGGVLARTNSVPVVVR